MFFADVFDPSKRSGMGSLACNKLRIYRGDQNDQDVVLIPSSSRHAKHNLSDQPRNHLTLWLRDNIFPLTATTRVRHGGKILVFEGWL